MLDDYYCYIDNNRPIYFLTFWSQTHTQRSSAFLDEPSSRYVKVTRDPRVVAYQRSFTSMIYHFLIIKGETN